MAELPGSVGTYLPSGPPRSVQGEPLCILCAAAGQTGFALPGERVCEMHMAAAVQAQRLAEDMTGQESTWTRAAALSPSGIATSSVVLHDPLAGLGNPARAATVVARAQVTDIPRNVFMVVDQVDTVGPQDMQEDDVCPSWRR